MTLDHFNQTAIRIETLTGASYDLLPFGDNQQGAVAVYLGHLIFQHSIGSQLPAKTVVLNVDDRFENTPQLQGFVDQLHSEGLTVVIQPPACPAV